ncbi:hypothetical protein PENTCL1PPCAC_10460, partial [Pristionchus entomophagus]
RHLILIVLLASLSDAVVNPLHLGAIVKEHLPVINNLVDLNAHGLPKDEMERANITLVTYLGGYITLDEAMSIVARDSPPLYHALKPVVDQLEEQRAGIRSEEGLAFVEQAEKRIKRILAQTMSPEHLPKGEHLQSLQSLEELYDEFLNLNHEAKEEINNSYKPFFDIVKDSQMTWADLNEDPSPPIETIPLTHARSSGRI